MCAIAGGAQRQGAEAAEGSLCWYSPGRSSGQNRLLVSAQTTGGCAVGGAGGVRGLRGAGGAVKCHCEHGRHVIGQQVAIAQLDLKTGPGIFYTLV